MKNLIYCGMLIVPYLMLCVDVSVAGISTTSNVIVKQCMQDGGYCQNSWDCCSNRCLSFSYKCVKGPQTPVYEPNYAPIEDPTVVAVGTLEELVNRFGGGDDDDKTPAKSTTPASTSTSSSTSIRTDSQCIGIGYGCADSSQCCSNDCLHYQNVHICIEKRTTTTTSAATTTTASTTVAPCLQIGQKCYRNEECCTQRCHGFLHQCVT